MNLEGTREMKQGGGTGTTRLTPSVLRVLIVDDELGTRKLLTAMLREAGVPCKAAACAEEGLIALETEPTDAVLSDLQMPGISGMAFLAEVRERYRHLAFVMMTGVEDIRVGIEAMKRGADDYLVKPLQIEIVMASLERALKKSAWSRRWRTTVSASRKWSKSGQGNLKQRFGKSSAVMRTRSRLWVQPSIFVTVKHLDTRSA